MTRSPTLTRTLLRGAACRAGNITVLFAMLLPFVIGSAGFGAETSYWYYKHVRLQAAADQAAYAAAIAKRAGASDTAITTAALQAASSNGFDSVNGVFEVNTPPKSGDHQNAMAVEVILTEPEARFFTGVFSTDPVHARSRSVASYERSTSNVCVLSLSSSAPGAVTFSGSSSLSLNGCSVMSNSIDAAGVLAQGSAQASMPCVYSVGGVQLTSGVTLTACSSPVTQAPPLGDPFAGVTLPTVPGTCSSGGNYNGGALQPGCYSGLSVNGAVALAPGVYVIKGGVLKLNGNASLSGTGVTFFLTAGASVSMNGNATVDLTAPTSGPYAGMLFIDDPASPGGSNTFNGTANSRMTGALYFPKQDVQYSGNFSGVNGCTHIVANTVTWTGHASFSANCSTYGMDPPVAHNVVSVME